MKINLDIELMRTLVAFADTGSFKLASQIVRRSPPAVSMQMKKLERLVDQKLFVRQGREIALTEQGIHIVLSVRKILTAHDRMVEDLRGEEVCGEVRIGMPDDYAPLVLPHILHQFEEFYPSVSLNILANTTPVLEERLRNGDLDIAVLATLSPLESDVILSREEIVWVTSGHHETHHQRPLILALFSDESPIYRATIASLNDFETENGDTLDFRIRVLSKSSAVLVAVAETGFAIATMARCVVPQKLRILGLVDGFPAPGDVYIVMRGSADSQSLAVSRMTKRIVEGFQEMSTMAGEEIEPSPNPMDDRLIGS